MSLYMRATRDGKSIRITKSTLWKYNLSEKHLMVVFFFSLFLLSLPTLQMNLKPFWSACPPIASWMCPSLPSSGQLTCHSRSGIRSLSPAPPWYWEKPRRLSGNCSPWASAALNNLTSVYPERGNPQCYSDPKHLNEWGRRCSFGRRTASHKQSKLANLYLSKKCSVSNSTPLGYTHKGGWDAQLKQAAEFCCCCSAALVFTCNTGHFRITPCTFRR